MSGEDFPEDFPHCKRQKSGKAHKQMDFSAFQSLRMNWKSASERRKFNYQIVMDSSEIGKLSKIEDFPGFSQHFSTFCCSWESFGDS
jgi:hypothetical protein